jgi:hypothetical protein
VLADAQGVRSSVTTCPSNSKEVGVKTKLILLLCAALALSLPACGGDPNAPGVPTTYTNADFGFQLEYLSSWVVSVDPPSLVGQPPDKIHVVSFVRREDKGAFVVFVQQLDSEEALADYAIRQLDGMQSGAGVVFSTLAPAQLGDLDALETETFVTQEGQELTQRVLFAVSGNRGYAVSLIAPVDSATVATLDDMLASFAFLP